MTINKVLLALCLGLTLASCAPAAKTQTAGGDFQYPVSGEVVQETPHSYVRRFVDDQYGNVCYTYADGISCVPKHQ